MNTNASNDNLNATSEAEQQLDAHINERAKHPKMEELSKGMSESKSYYFISHKNYASAGIWTSYEFHAVKAMAYITHECLAFDIKEFGITKLTLEKGSMYPRIKNISLQDLQDEAFMESNHVIGQISAS
jgi:hypothetical protein